MLLIFSDVVDLDVPTNTAHFWLNQSYFFFPLRKAVCAGGRKEEMGKHLHFGCFYRSISIPIHLCPRL